jgi:hypothetical protein
MAKITINNVPEHIAKQFWKNISYNDLDKNFLPKKRKRLTVNWLTTEAEDKIIKNLNDPKNTNYWPMSIEEFISEVKKW